MKEKLIWFSLIFFCVWFEMEADRRLYKLDTWRLKKGEEQFIRLAININSQSSKFISVSMNSARVSRFDCWHKRKKGKAGRLSLPPPSSQPQFCSHYLKMLFEKAISIKCKEWKEHNFQHKLNLHFSRILNHFKGITRRNLLNRFRAINKTRGKHKLFHRLL